MIALRVVLELSAEEAASLLRISATAMTRLSRALKKLQATLEDDDV